MDAPASSSSIAAAGGHDNAGDGEKKDEAAAKKLPLLGMFRYADRLDVLLMVVGTVGAVANGMVESFVTLLFGNVINSFGQSTAESILPSVTKVHPACNCGLRETMNSYLHVVSNLLIGLPPPAGCS